MKNEKQTQENRLAYQKKKMKEYNKTHTGIFIPKELNKKLKEYAKKLKWSKNRTAEEFIQYGLENLSIEQPIIAKKKL